MASVCTEVGPLFAERELNLEFTENALKEMSDRAREALQHRLLTARDEPERASLVAALSRIDAGTFGFCTKCHGSIGRHRLVAMPEASCCLTCSSQE